MTVKAFISDHSEVAYIEAKQNKWRRKENKGKGKIIQKFIFHKVKHTEMNMIQKAYHKVLRAVIKDSTIVNMANLMVNLQPKRPGISSY